MIMLNRIIQSNRIGQDKLGQSLSAGLATWPVLFIGSSQMKQIQLSSGQIALVDDKNFEWLNQWKWHIGKSGSGKTFYAQRIVYIGGGAKNPKYKVIKMHRLIMNAQKGQQIDHRNGNGLNNQEHNLRFSTASQKNQISQKY